MLDVRKLMAQDSAELAGVEKLQDPRRRSDRGVLRIASGGEGIRLRLVDQIHLGHR